MNPKKTIFCLCFISYFLYGNAQTDKKVEPLRPEDTTAVNSLLQQSKDKLAVDPATSISLAFQAKSISEKIDFPKGTANALKSIGLGYRRQGKNLCG